MRVLLVEDEPVIARRTARIAREALPEATIVSVDSLEGGQALLAQGPFDMLLLDLNLSGQDGFKLLAKAGQAAACVIVVSAYGERAVEGFDREVVDFVAKPYSPDRLKAAIGRGLARLRTQPTRTLAVRVRSGWRYVRLSDIDHVRAADDYCELVLASGERLLHSATLERLARDLPPAFRRAHRSAIVNLERVSALRRRSTGGYEVTTKGGATVPVGRSYLAAFR